MPASRAELLRELPSIESLASTASGPHSLAVRAAREIVAEVRELILEGGSPEVGRDALGRTVEARIERLSGGTLRPVINATGIVLHTNLGRAPLAPEAARAVTEAASGYSNLEYDLHEGARGSRHAHLEPLLCEIAGSEAAIAVNNNAGAVLLALAAMASGREVVTGRDALIEIGGSFRIPDILIQSGAALVEVGTTNRTRAADFEAAIGARTAALLRVHQSNFRTVGFTESASLSELCAIGRRQGIAVIDDLGSGAVEPIGDEPLLRASVEAGATLVCCSADKLLGGPQAGIIAGETAAVERCRSHPLARALRLDKLQIAALEATLRVHRDQGPGAIPALAMLAAPEQELRARAELIAGLIGDAAGVVDSTSRPGGGTLPTTELPGPVCVVSPGGIGADELLAAMRAGSPPVIARIEHEMVLLDPRTMDDASARAAVQVVAAALA